MANIDSLIARLTDVHASIALVSNYSTTILFNLFPCCLQINSPVRLSSAAADVSTPYLSLQPPPGRQLDGGVQFEDLDLYMWPSAQYKTPSLIFYAGPVRFTDQQIETEAETREVSRIHPMLSHFSTSLAVSTRMWCGLLLRKISSDLAGSWATTMAMQPTLLSWRERAG